MNLKGKNLAYLPQYYCSHGNALVAFCFCANRLGKNSKKIRQTRRNFLHASMVKQASLGGLAGKMIWQMADETISVWQDKTDGVEMGPSQQCVPQSHTDAARTPGISNMGSFNNYVDQILSNFDHLPTSIGQLWTIVDILYIIYPLFTWLSLDFLLTTIVIYLPFLCPHSYWMPPSTF